MTPSHTPVAPVPGNIPTTHESDDVGTKVDRVVDSASAVDITTRRLEPKPQKAPQTQLSRAQILHATAICLAEDGYDGTTIRRIARQLNCAVGSIYRYFEDKRSLLDAVTQARFEPVAQVAEVSAERSAALYAHAAADEPEQYRLMFWLASVGKRDSVPGLPLIVAKIIDAWEVKMGDRRKAERFWSHLHGRIMLGEVGPGAPETTAVENHDG